MARLLTTGFELNDLTGNKEFFFVGSTPTGSINSTTKNTGTYSYRNNPSAAVQSVTISLGTNTDKTIYGRFWYYATTHPASNTLVSFVADSAGTTIMMRFRGTGAGLKVMNGPNTQVGSDIALTTGTWYCFEFKVLSHASTGTIDVKLDGSSVVSVTGQNTNGADPRTLAFGTGAAVTHDYYIDDVAVNTTSGSNNNSWTGMGKVICLRPNATGDNADWTRGGSDSGANWSQQDEVTPDDATDYVESVTLNQIDDYNCGASGIGASDTVSVVHVGCRIANDTGDGITAYQLRLKKEASGTVTASTATIHNKTTWVTNGPSTTALNPYPITADLDPDGAAWSTSKLDAMQIGIKLTVVGTFKIRSSALWAMVDYTPVVGGSAAGPLISGKLVNRSALLGRLVA